MPLPALILCWLFICAASATAAAPLSFPANAEESASETVAAGSYDLPTGPWRDGIIPVETVEGAIERSVWRLPAPGQTTLQLLAPLRQQLVTGGWNIAYECATESCGGFDFRFGTDVTAAPAMLVDLGDFRFLSARKGDAAISLFVSRTNSTGYIQIIRIADSAADMPTPEPTGPALVQPAAVSTSSSGDFASDFETLGHVVLPDLSFVTGSSTLGDGPFPSLDRLATYLKDNPEISIALVGHTDSEGSLQGNIGLSRARAVAVKDRLASAYGIAANRMEAEGMGYLAPVSTNLTDEGRARNRRVEAIITSTGG